VRRAETANFVDAICGALASTMMFTQRRSSAVAQGGAGSAYQGRCQGRQNMLFAPLKTAFSDGRVS
jgi:hypothetical protein